MEPIKAVERIVSPILAICAVIVTALLVKNQFFAPSPPPIPDPEGYLRGRRVANAVTTTGGHLMGDSSALRIIEFADFECPFCAKAAEVVSSFSATHPSGIAVEFHHMPITAHRLARPAALASECASEQGRFAEFFHLVFRNQTRLGKWSWREFASRAGVKNLSQFDECFRTERYADRVDADAELADRLEISATPSWILHDSLYAGPASPRQLQRWIARDTGRTAKGRFPVSGQ